MGLVEARVDGEKALGDIVFPKTYICSDKSSKSGVGDLIAAVLAEQKQLETDLERHGAVLIRGFHVKSAEDVAAVVKAFGWPEQPYEGAANRRKMGERVYTASETPVDIALPFHHEMSLIKEPCSKLFFVCTQPPAFGGETSIVRSDVVVEEMEKALPEVMAKFNEVGVMSILHTRNVEQRNGENVIEKVWQRMFKTKDEEEARKRAMEKLACNSVTFNSDGTADFYYGPMLPTRELNGRKVWFISILGYSMDERNGYVTYGDGSKIPDKATETFSKILEDNSVEIAWEKGDLLVVDNFRVQHARRAGKPPRCILVSLCK